MRSKLFYGVFKDLKLKVFFFFFGRFDEFRFWIFNE